MKTKHLSLGVLCAGVALLAGCSSYPAGFLPASIPAEQGKYTVLNNGNEVSGSDTAVVIFGFGAKLPGSMQGRAYRNALKQCPDADGLLEMNQQIDRYGGGPIVVQTLTVYGKPIKLNK